MELVRGGSSGDGIAGIEPVYQIPVEYTHFTSVPDSVKPVAIGRMLVLKEMVLLFQPHQDLEGLVGSGPVPSARRFGSDLALGHQFLSPEAIAGRGDRFTFFQGVEVGFLFEFFPEFLTTGLEKFHVRFALGFHLSTHDKTVIGVDLLGIPPFKL